MSEEKENKVLDLDELFGQARAVKVRWQGQEYEFLRTDSLSPRQLVQLNQIHLETAKLQKAVSKKSSSEDEQEAQLNQIENLLNEMLGILCPKFPAKEIDFAKKSTVIQFYMEQTQIKNAKQAMSKQRTGEKRSRG